jgi:hypothetical protein
LMVLVYGDEDAATTAREHSRSMGQPLVPGYGEAAWLGNVALVESNKYDLGRYYQAQQERDDGIVIQSNSGPSSTEVLTPGRVDDDFLLALAPTSTL